MSKLITSALRKEFEPLMLSAHGLHRTAEICAKAWDDKIASGREAAIEIARADEWLRLCKQTVWVNEKVGTTQQIKHIASDWYAAVHDGNGYMSNGHFLMAAQRLGFKMRGIPGRYCFAGGFVDDIFDAYINIRADSFPKVKSN
jgi:hypothetical protein